jgi:opacity protein-like surface antigen
MGGRNWEDIMRGKAVLGAVLLAMLPAIAVAQDRTIVGEIGMGPTIVFGPAADNIGTGFNFNFGVIYKTSNTFGIRIDTMVTKHDVKDEVTQRLNVGDGDAWMWHLSGNALVSSGFDKRVSVYGTGGAGVYYRKVNLLNPGVGFVTVCDPWLLICYDVPVLADQIVGARSSTDFGMNFGGGINLRTGSSASVYVEVRYHYVWGPKADPTVNPLATGSRSANSQLMPIVFGVRF